jgi:hypothetical protein
MLLERWELLMMKLTMLVIVKYWIEDLEER